MKRVAVFQWIVRMIELKKVFIRNILLINFLFINNCFAFTAGHNGDHRLIAFSPFSENSSFARLQMRVDGKSEFFFFEGKIILSESEIFNTEVEKVSYPAEYSLNKSWRYFRRLEKIEKGDAFSMNKTYILPLPLGKNTFLFSCKTEESKVAHKMRVNLNEGSIICLKDCSLESFKVTDVCEL